MAEEILGYVRWLPPITQIDVTEIEVVFLGPGQIESNLGFESAQKIFLPANRTSVRIRVLRGFKYHLEVRYGRKLTMPLTIGHWSAIDFTVP